MDLMYYILFPFSWLLTVFYHAFNNYGMAVILFALVVKIVLFPLTLKGKRGMIQMSMLSGKLDQLKRQYGKDQQRYNMEMQKLYQREKVNPMGGCLWSLLPILVLFPLYAILRQPLKYLMGLTADQIQQVAQTLNWSAVALNNGWIREAADTFSNYGYNQLYLASLITRDTLPSVTAALGEGTRVFAANFRFLGVDLARVPTWRVWTDPTWPVIGAFLMVMVSTGLSIISGKVAAMTNKINGQAESDQTAKTNRTLMLMTPLMSLWIGFSMPAALCIYWIANSLFGMLQDMLAARMLRKDYEAARQAAEERARQEKLEEKQRKEEARLERERRAEEERRTKKSAAAKAAQSGGPAVNKEDSREGLRAYARGHAYLPDRYGGVTAYTDPSLNVTDGKAKPGEKPITEKVDLTGLKEKKESADAAAGGSEENKESV